VHLTKYYSGDQIKKNEMGGPCGTYRRRGGLHTAFWRGNLRETDNFEDLGLEKKIILKWIFKKWNRGVWTGLI
jgi:hypothetical protein